MKTRTRCASRFSVRCLVAVLLVLGSNACGDDTDDETVDADTVRRDVGSLPDAGLVDARLDAEAGSEDGGLDAPRPDDITNGDTGGDTDDAGDANDASDGASAPDLTDSGTANCGDGTRDAGEECDDGNTQAGDGCGPTCLRETSRYCSPCSLNSECNGSGDLCVDGGCALDCSDWDCPLGSVCEDVAFGVQTLRQCVPTSGSCFPPEDCGNGADDDRDGRVDCDDADCADDRRCAGATTEDCGNATDDDGDGLVDCGDADCAASPLCAPGAEQCTNGIDDDGDLAVDCDDPDCTTSSACAAGPGLCESPGTATLGTQTGRTAAGPSRTETAGFCGGRGPETALTFVAPESRTYCADTFGSTFDTVLSVRTVCASEATEEDCNDDTSGVQSQIQFRALAGEALTLVVDGFDEFEFGAYTLTITADLCGGTPTEVCDNGRDDDLDFDTDCDDTDCAEHPSCVPGPNACDAPQTATIGVQSADILRGESTQEGTCAGRGPELAWVFTAAATGDYCATTLGSDYDTVLYVRSSCSDTGSELACNDDSGGAQSRVDFLAVAGAPTYIFTDGFLPSSTGRATLNIAAGRCPAPGVEICDNGVDDDGDGDIDCEDSSCRGDEACPEICDNDYDDDGDFRTDCYDDDCDGSPLCVEICDDLTDNDGDFTTDCRDDDCAEDPACIESACDDGRDNDGDFLSDCSDDDCAFDPACMESECDDGFDNDDDFDTDCDDSDCVDDPACAPLPDPCAVARAAAPGTQSGIIVAEDSQHGGSCIFGGGGEEHVWRFTAPSTGSYCLDTLGSSVDTVLYARRTCGDPASELACNDDSFGSASRIEIALDAEETAWVFVDTYSSFGVGPYDLNIAAGPCP